MLLPTAERVRRMRSAAAAKLPASTDWTKAAMPFRRSLTGGSLGPGRFWILKRYTHGKSWRHCGQIRTCILSTSMTAQRTLPEPDASFACRHRPVSNNLEITPMQAYRIYSGRNENALERFELK